MGAAWLSRLREAAGPVGFGAAVSEGFAGSAAGPGARHFPALDLNLMHQTSLWMWKWRCEQDQEGKGQAGASPALCSLQLSCTRDGLTSHPRNFSCVRPSERSS